LEGSERQGQVENVPLSRGDLLSAGRQLLQQTRVELASWRVPIREWHTHIGPCIDSRGPKTKSLERFRERPRTQQPHQRLVLRRKQF